MRCGVWVSTVAAAALVALTSSVVGCGGGLPRRVVSQARRDWGCDALSISGRRVRGDGYSETYEVHCGARHLTMTCPVGPHSRWHRCTYGGEEPRVAERRRERERGRRAREEDVVPAPAAPVAGPAGPSWSDAQIGAAVARVSDALGACTGTRERYTLELSFDRAGRVASAGSPDLDGAALSCVLEVLRAIDLPGDVDTPRATRLRFAQAEGVIDGEVTGARVEAAPAGDARARAAIDRHAAEILACVARPVVAIEVAWAASTLARVAVRGLEGSAEEACVRPALASETFPASAGSVLHAVR